MSRANSKSEFVTTTYPHDCVWVLQVHRVCGKPERSGHVQQGGAIDTLHLQTPERNKEDTLSHWRRSVLPFKCLSTCSFYVVFIRLSLFVSSINGTFNRDYTFWVDFWHNFFYGFFVPSGGHTDKLQSKHITSTE